MTIRICAAVMILFLVVPQIRSQQAEMDHAMANEAILLSMPALAAAVEPPRQLDEDVRDLAMIWSSMGGGLSKEMARDGRALLVYPSTPLFEKVEGELVVWAHWRDEPILRVPHCLRAQFASFSHVAYTVEEDKTRRTYVVSVAKPDQRFTVPHTVSLPISITTHGRWAAWADGELLTGTMEHDELRTTRVLGDGFEMHQFYDSALMWLHDGRYLLARGTAVSSTQGKPRGYVPPIRYIVILYDSKMDSVAVLDDVLPMTRGQIDDGRFFARSGRRAHTAPRIGKVTADGQFEWDTEETELRRGDHPIISVSPSGRFVVSQTEPPLRRRLWLESEFVVRRVEKRDTAPLPLIPEGTGPTGWVTW